MRSPSRSLTVSSPRKRGSAAEPDGADRAGQVLPARAGVSR
ncbi:hypothetical protein KCH_77060 [Kitasatospora cheerisanensis KCTC 2395]|uniref:Uncharacterized protein n=1 Tax=Kitasatospora cheerisanensis KCTC 2395 TaxID=1348663 RepID=A0A066YKV2_9ACTN|nr:hypothetical protein KCH_77060 [Kitasatospora cheerisanensis KCTC 2395]